MKTMQKYAAVAAALMLLLAALPLSAAADDTQGFENNDCLVIATEPGATSEYVGYFKNGEEQPKDSMKWVDDGVHGKALSLNGTSEYLQLGYNQLRMSQMTFSTWINFQGTKDEKKPNDAYWQRLFTIESGTDCYLTVSPHAKDTSESNADGILDGIYMEYFRSDGEENYTLKSYTGASPNKSHFGLPQNEWHHVAVVTDAASVKLYVDGNLVLEEIFLVPIVQMSADSMFIGGGLWGDPLLYALVDDMMMFDRALNVQEIAALMQTGNVESFKNPAAATTTQSVYMPTSAAEATVSTAPTSQPPDRDDGPLGIPLVAFAAGVALTAFFIVLTVVVNMYESSIRQQAPKATAENEDEKPAVSIKEAAIQKRREEHERFLTEEQKEKEEQEMKAAQQEQGDEGGEQA